MGWAGEDTLSLLPKLVVNLREFLAHHARLIQSGSTYHFAAALGAVFGAGTTVSASLRGKDGPLNYFIGGCMAGAVLGAKRE